MDPRTVDFTAPPARATTELVGDGWKVLAVSGLSDAAAARQLVVQLDLDRAMPHDSRCVVVRSYFGDGTITSRGYPPASWEYVHARVLSPETSAATTLDSEASRDSLRNVLAACLARVRCLSTLRSKPARWSGARLDETLGPALHAADPVEFARRLQHELARRLTAVSHAGEEAQALFERLRALGHDLHREDSDGGSWEIWRTPRLCIELRYPDVQHLASGDLPDQELVDENRVDEVRVEVSIRSPRSPAAGGTPAGSSGSG